MHCSLIEYSVIIEVICAFQNSSHEPHLLLSTWNNARCDWETEFLNFEFWLNCHMWLVAAMLDSVAIHSLKQGDPIYKSVGHWLSCSLEHGFWTLPVNSLFVFKISLFSTHLHQNLLGFMPGECLLNQRRVYWIRRRSTESVYLPTAHQFSTGLQPSEIFSSSNLIHQPTYYTVLIGFQSCSWFDF